MDISEAKIQSSCVTWLWNERPETRGCFFSVNNNSEHVGRATLRKSLGLVAGVSDTFLVWGGKSYAIEFKTEKGKQSKRQEWWQGVIESHGVEYVIIRRLDEFKEFIFKVTTK